MGAKVTELLDFLQNDAEIGKVRDQLTYTKEAAIYGLYEGQRTFVTASLTQQNASGNLLVLCDTQKRAKELWEDLVQLLPAYEVLYFPALEMIPYEVIAQSGELEQKRLEVLSHLMLEREKRFAVITTIEGLSKKLLPKGDFGQGFLQLEVGMCMEQEALKAHLVTFGYERTEQVEHRGQFSVRGGIFDIYSPFYKDPLRLEFFDDEVDSIRFFETNTQCSIEKVKTAWIVPGREFFLMPQCKEAGLQQIRQQFSKQMEQLPKRKDREPMERLQGKVGELLEKLQQDMGFAGIEQYQTFFYPDSASLLDYMGQGLFLVFDESNRIQEAQEYLEKERRQTFSQLLLKGSVLPGQAEYFFDLEDMVRLTGDIPHVCFSLLPKDSVFQQRSARMTLDCQNISSFFGNPQLLVEELQTWQKQKYSVLILLTSAAKALRLQQMLGDNDILCSWIADRYQADPGQIYLAYGNISHGARFPQSRLVFISETEVFQQQKKRVNKKFFQEDGQKITRLDDLKIGDYVVHMNHGIGRYMGVERLKVQDVERDYLIVKYSDDGKLYIPVDQFDLLQKYTVNDGVAPKVNKLGGKEWQRTKNKVKASVEKLAEGLLEIYARRKSQEGYAFSPDDQWQKEFEDAFPYVETEDQLKAIEDVKRDMMSNTVMDRLICGDVGYGKTEVAIRAAFKAVNDGKQVAVLVPTTVLAQQHYTTFAERFQPYGVQVRMLSRFVTPKQQKETVEGLKTGAVDVVVGTHKLLSKSISFQDLGLLVVDEEQRFGVTHKEKIKQMRSQVDVLTLSATPIPRTLHMSLVGIRDMSVIETPPQDRYPIQTYIVERTPELIKDAIRRELGRGGQVYVVHNRVEDIDQLAEEISLMVPEARILVGHGQMKEHQLEQIMMDFIAHEADVLVCTTIIETGLDISNANTMIVDEADKMGLSQLYQLRGRVGRSNRIAYAYLTYKKDKTLSQLAEKRLAAIREYTELGSGFKIAMRDLEIRGAGNLLGAEQHGHVAAVGFDLYCTMLDEAIRELKGEKTGKRREVEIDLQVSAFIPEYYIRDSAVKLGFYQRIQQAQAISRLHLLADEMIDRFGDIPPETWNLLRAAELKIYCTEIGIRSLKQKGGIVSARFEPDTKMDLPKLQELIKKYKRQLTYGSDGGELVVRITVGSASAEQCLELVKDILLAMLSIVQ